MTTQPYHPVVGGMPRPAKRRARPLLTQPEQACKLCNGRMFKRIARVGFWERVVLPFFNRYPWRCVACSKVTYHTARSASSRSVSSPVQ